MSSILDEGEISSLKDRVLTIQKALNDERQRCFQFEQQLKVHLEKDAVIPFLQNQMREVVGSSLKIALAFVWIEIRRMENRKRNETARVGTDESSSSRKGG